MTIWALIRRIINMKKGKIINPTLLNKLNLLRIIIIIPIFRIFLSLVAEIRRKRNQISLI